VSVLPERKPAEGCEADYFVDILYRWDMLYSDDLGGFVLVWMDGCMDGMEFGVTFTQAWL
jgi:hypothetical protein